MSLVTASNDCDGADLCAFSASLPFTVPASVGRGLENLDRPLSKARSAAVTGVRIWEGLTVLRNCVLELASDALPGAVTPAAVEDEAIGGLGGDQSLRNGKLAGPLGCR